MRGYRGFFLNKWSICLGGIKSDRLLGNKYSKKRGICPNNENGGEERKIILSSRRIFVIFEKMNRNGFNVAEKEKDCGRSLKKVFINGMIFLKKVKKSFFGIKV